MSPGLSRKSQLVSRVSSVPDFLAPRLFSSSCESGKSTVPHLLQFSTSTQRCRRQATNNNRGISPLRRTGPRHLLSVHKLPLPKPNLNPASKTPIVTDPAHGLWGFFPEAKSLPIAPEDMAYHGRAWTVEELRRKSWEDLHGLWWMCAKDRNRVATSQYERLRLCGGFGQAEEDRREEIVKETQKNIREVLTKRWYAWEDARKLAMSDATVNLTGDGPAYEPNQNMGEAKGSSIQLSNEGAPGRTTL